MIKSLKSYIMCFHGYIRIYWILFLVMYYMKKIDSFLLCIIRMGAFLSYCNFFGGDLNQLNDQPEILEREPVKVEFFPLDVIIHYVLRFVPYFDVLETCLCLGIDSKTAAAITAKIYKLRLTKTITNGGFMGKSTTYTIDGIIHREGGLPATTYENGTCLWIKKGIHHRDGDLPSSIRYNENGTCLKLWFRNGHLHRDGDMPAYENTDGTLQWYQFGKLNRANDMPTIIYRGGHRYWHENGKLSRRNGKPAVMMSSGEQYYYIDNIAQIRI
jgi:hypothetical protein